MVLEQFALNLDTLIFILVFGLFILIAKKVLDTIMHISIVAILSLVFPFVGNYFGLSLSTDLNSLLSYVILGTGLYLVYIILRILYRTYSFAGKLNPFKKKN